MVEFLVHYNRVETFIGNMLHAGGLTGPAARGPVKLQNIRYYPYAEYTRVVLDLTAELKISEKVLKGSRAAVCSST